MLRHKIISVRDIDNRIIDLQRDIDHEKNKKEKARLEDEQAALKLTLRVMPIQTAESLKRD